MLDFRPIMVGWVWHNLLELLYYPLCQWWDICVGQTNQLKPNLHFGLTWISTFKGPANARLDKIQLPMCNHYLGVVQAYIGFAYMLCSKFSDFNSQFFFKLVPILDAIIWAIQETWRTNMDKHGWVLCGLHRLNM